MIREKLCLYSCRLEHLLLYSADKWYIFKSLQMHLPDISGLKVNAFCTLFCVNIVSVILPLSGYNKLNEYTTNVPVDTLTVISTVWFTLHTLTSSVDTPLIEKPVIFLYKEYMYFYKRRYRVYHIYLILKLKFIMMQTVL